MKKADESISLLKWIWLSYLKTALIPLIIVELGFISIYFITNSWVHQGTNSYFKDEVNAKLVQTSYLEADTIQQQLQGITYLTDIYAKQTGTAMKTPGKLTGEQADSMAYSRDGAYYTAKDTEGAAVFYSGYYAIGEAEKDKVARVLTTQQLMKDIQTSNPLIASIYFNTYDSLNLIYPYFDVISQYATKTNIPEFNFYYEADEVHNPTREVQWTDVYLDPAGHGWMASCIAPVYNGDFLEGVVGIDVTVKNIVEQVLSMDISWDGYGMLVDNNGTILALPEGGEGDWGLTELTDHTYSEAVMQDTFKSEDFNIFTRNGLSDFTNMLKDNDEGFSTAELNGESKVISWNTIKETGWKFIIVVPEKNIYAKVNELKEQSFKIGLVMILGIILFYLVFFIVLYRRARRMSRDISQPLQIINEKTKEIGKGNYYQTIPEFDVTELKKTSEAIIDMGTHLGKATSDLTAVNEALEANEAYLKALVNSIDDAIFEADGNGIVKNFRSNDSRILERVFPDGIRKTTNLESFLSKDEAEKYLTVARHVIESGETASVEYNTDTPRGVRWFLTRIARIPDGSRTVAVSLRDITEQKMLESRINEALIEAEKASQVKSQFLSNMSHELRTPLNAVLGFAQVLDMDPDAPLNELQQDCVHEIEKAGSHLLKLINEILDLAKIESGKVTLSIEPVKVSEIIEETISLMNPMAEKYGVILEQCCANQLCGYVSADKMRLKQVLINLLSNAIKYNKEDGQVKYYCETINDTVRFHVEDTGIGIPQSELDEIFKPFHRLNASNNTVEGTGIGLPMVKQLMEMMGGTIFIESKLGEGSHFYIELPYSEAEEPYIETLKENGIEADLKIETARKKILYVEDNPANLTLVERLLKHMPKVTLISAFTAEVGIDLARAHEPDIILLDINLPNMDGYEMFKRLQGYEETRNIPVIAISANAMERDIQRAIALGFEEYITKPIDAKKFLEKLKKYLIEFSG